MFLLCFIINAFSLFFFDIVIIFCKANFYYSHLKTEAYINIESQNPKLLLMY